MGDLFRGLISREIADGTYRPTLRPEGRRARRAHSVTEQATQAKG